MQNQRKLSSAEKKVILFASLVRLGHEAFRRKTVDEIVLHILNNSRSLFPYDRSALVDVRQEKPELIAVSGVPAANPDSEYGSRLRSLYPVIASTKEATILRAEEIEKRDDLPSSVAGTLRNFFAAVNLLVLPIRSPDSDETGFFWVIEYAPSDIKDEYLVNTFNLLATHYGEALYHRIGQVSGADKGRTRWRKALSQNRVFALVILVFGVCLAAIRMPLRAVADIEFRPEKSTIVYAPYTGAIGQVHRDAGDQVQADTCILEYDTREMLYDLAIEQKRLAETLAELDLAKAQAFDKVEMRGKIKILDLTRQLGENRIAKCRWFLSRSRVDAGADGILVIADRQVLTGKRILAGEKLFEVVSREGIFAEVYLNEKDAAVLGEKTKLTIFPHIRPERPVHAEIISVSPVPLKNDRGVFTYVIRADLGSPENTEGIVCGMRGIASVEGDRVTLGYYLFRRTILWWRNL